MLFVNSKGFVWFVWWQIFNLLNKPIFYCFLVNHISSCYIYSVGWSVSARPFSSSISPRLIRLTRKKVKGVLFLYCNNATGPWNVIFAQMVRRVPHRGWGGWGGGWHRAATFWDWLFPITKHTLSLFWCLKVTVTASLNAQHAQSNRRCSKYKAANSSKK